MALENTFSFECKQGDDFTMMVNVSIDATPMDLTGYTAALMVRKSFGASTPLITATDLNGKIVFEDRVGGVLYWSIAHEDTTPIRFANADDETLDLVWDLELTDLSGNVLTPARGTMTLYREVTR